MATQLSRYCRWLINLCSNITFTLPIFSFYKVAPDIYRLGPRYQDITILSRMLLPPRSLEQYPLTCISPLPTAQLFFLVALIVHSPPRRKCTECWQQVDFASTRSRAYISTSAILWQLEVVKGRGLPVGGPRGVSLPFQGGFFYGNVPSIFRMGIVSVFVIYKRDICENNKSAARCCKWAGA